MYFFDSSAAEAVITLNVDPGTYRPALARFKSGDAGVQLAVIASMPAKSVSTRFGSKLGDEAMHADLPGAWVERDHGAAVLAELIERHLLGVEVEGRDDVVSLDRPAAKLVEHLLGNGGEVRVRRRQVVVQRPLETGPRPADGRVADDVSGQVALRIAPEVERSLVDLPLHVRRETPERGSRHDQSSIHGELRDPPDGVVLPSASAGAAQVCQYVVMTTSTPTSARATYVTRMIWRFTSPAAFSGACSARWPGSRRGGDLRAAGSSRGCSSPRRTRTAA